MADAAQTHVDLNRIDEATGGDRDFLQELVSLFFDDTDQRLQALQAALDVGDADSLAKAAHSLKGSSANLGAGGMQTLALRLEMMGKDGGLTDAPAILDSLRAEYDRVRTVLQDLVS